MRRMEAQLKACRPEGHSIRLLFEEHRPYWKGAYKLGRRRLKVACASSRLGQADTGATSGIDRHCRSPNVGIRGCGVACTTSTGVRGTSRPAVASVGFRARGLQEMAELGRCGPTCGSRALLSLRQFAKGSRFERSVLRPEHFVLSTKSSRRGPARCTCYAVPDPGTRRLYRDLSLRLGTYPACLGLRTASSDVDADAGSRRSSRRRQEEPLRAARSALRTEHQVVDPNAQEFVERGRVRAAPCLRWPRCVGAYRGIGDRGDEWTPSPRAHVRAGISSSIFLATESREV